MKTLIAVPCFNEAKTIVQVCEELKGIENAEVRVFLDGSTDGSSELVARHRIPYHNELRNIGLSGTFQTILQHFLRDKSFDQLLIVDGDGQFPISEIRKILLASAKMKVDFVSGSRFMQREDMLSVPIIKRWGNILVAKSLTQLLWQRQRGNRLRTKITDPSCGLRAYSRTAATLLVLDNEHSYTIQSWLRVIEEKISFAEIPIKVQYFEKRRSVISSNLFVYGAYIARVLSTNWLNLRFRLFLKLFLATFFLGLLFLFSFFAISLKVSQFSGNLYLGATGGFLVVCSLNCLVLFYVLRIFDHNKYLTFRLSLAHTQLLSEQESDIKEFLCANCSQN